MTTATSIKKLTATAALVILGIIATTNSGTAQTITFDNDDPGFVPNGFVSVDSSLASFSDTDGEDLLIGDFTPTSTGQGLTNTFDDTSGIAINFPVQPVTSLSLNFGNDQSPPANPGDLAQLQIFNGVTPLSTVTIPLDLDPTGDQIISFSDGAFNNAIFTFTNPAGTPIALAEVVDNVTFQQAQTPQPNPEPEPIPEPSFVLCLLIFGAFGARELLKRKQKKCQNQTPCI